MVNKCCVGGCCSNYKGEETVSVFSFPSDENIKNRWIKFVSRKDWQPTSSAVICIKHFTKQFTQHLQNHRPHIKYPFQENPPKKEFFKKISMMNLKGTTILLVWKVLLNQTVHMVILYAKYEDHVAFHKIVLNELHVPEVTACIRVDDKLHVKLFL